jgi:hypothetical protein
MAKHTRPLHREQANPRVTGKLMYGRAELRELVSSERPPYFFRKTSANHFELSVRTVGRIRPMGKVNRRKSSQEILFGRIVRKRGKS